MYIGRIKKILVKKREFLKLIDSHNSVKKECVQSRKEWEQMGIYIPNSCKKRSSLSSYIPI